MRYHYKTIKAPLVAVEPSPDLDAELRAELEAAPPPKQAEDFYVLSDDYPMPGREFDALLKHMAVGQSFAVPTDSKGKCPTGVHGSAKKLGMTVVSRTFEDGTARDWREIGRAHV